MNKKIFAVCDLEVEYAVNFMEYMNERQNIPFEVRAFTTAESLLNVCKSTPIELLLISSKAMCPEVKEAGIGKVVILTEGMQPAALDSYPSVYKYQPTANVLREVMACYGTEPKHTEGEVRIWKPGMKVIGIYSPLHRCMKTSVALTMGQLLARKQPVLYMNLEEYSGLEALLGRTFEEGISDLLYCSRQMHTNLIQRLRAMVCSVNNLDILPPARNPWDIRTASWEDWKELLTEISRGSSYEVILLDIGSEAEELFQLLDYCDQIYMPVLNDRISQCKLAQFETLLDAWGSYGIAGKLHHIHPPFYTSSEQGAVYVEQMIWSELGDYVRELLDNGAKADEAEVFS